MKANYHTHTTRCQHALGTEREYVEAAIRGGLSVLGFSDHVPYPFLDGHRSHMRMSLEGTKDYFRTLLDLKEEFKDQIEIRIGFEAEYDPEGFHRLKAFLDDFPCDYLIEGQHFLDVEHERIYCGMQDDGEDLLRAYADRVMAGMESGQFLYLAHPDLPDFRGKEEVYDRIMRPVCRTARKTGTPLEINLLGMKGRRAYPHASFFTMAAEEGCMAILGVDAHEPGMLEDHILHWKGRDFARQCGIPVIEELRIK